MRHAPHHSSHRGRTHDGGMYTEERIRHTVHRRERDATAHSHVHPAPEVWRGSRRRRVWRQIHMEVAVLDVWVLCAISFLCELRCRFDFVCMPALNIVPQQALVVGLLLLRVAWRDILLELVSG